MHVCQKDRTVEKASLTKSSDFLSSSRSAAREQLQRHVSRMDHLLSQHRLVRGVGLVRWCIAVLRAACLRRTLSRRQHG